MQLARQQTPHRVQRPADELIPKDLVWRTVHSVTEDEMRAMDVLTLEFFLGAMRTRRNNASGEEANQLDGRICIAEKLSAEKLSQHYEKLIEQEEQLVRPTHPAPPP